MGSPHHDLSSSIMALSSHKNFQKTIGKQSPIVLKQSPIVKNPPLVNLQGKTLPIGLHVTSLTKSSIIYLFIHLICWFSIDFSFTYFPSFINLLPTHNTWMEWVLTWKKPLKFSLQVLEKSFIFHLKQKITSKFHIFANKKGEYRFSTCSRVGWSKMSMVGQRESDGIFVSRVKAKELMIIGSSLLLFLFQWENKHDFITIGWLIYTRFAPPYPTKWTI